MKLLIAVSSKHGSTREIAKSMAATIRDAGIEVDVVDAQGVESVAPYDAVIVGSALYLGRWMGPARDLVNHSADALRSRPVWLFSSWATRARHRRSRRRRRGHEAHAAVGAREHRVFAGKADKGEFGFFERRMVSMVKSPWGDHRDWAAIGTWARSIADALTAVPA